jgi:type IV secretory pathway VirB2 component (pilin)
VLFGEELSWGQRLLGFTGPEALAEHNRQHEFNVHNLAGVNESIRDVGVVLMLIAFLALPLLIERNASAARLAQQLRVVVPGPLCTSSALLAIAYMRIPRWLGRNDYGFDECGELFLAATVLAYALQVARANPDSVTQPASSREAQEPLAVELLL